MGLHTGLLKAIWIRILSKTQNRSVYTSPCSRFEGVPGFTPGQRPYPDNSVNLLFGTDLSVLTTCIKPNYGFTALFHVYAPTPTQQEPTLLTQLPPSRGCILDEEQEQEDFPQEGQISIVLYQDAKRQKGSNSFTLVVKNIIDTTLSCLVNAFHCIK